MSKADHRQRFFRVLEFLLALTDPRIYTQLALGGFTNDTRRQGWRLFLRAGGYGVDMRHTVGSEGTRRQRLCHRVEAFEEEWYDVAEAALQRACRDLHTRVFRGLGKATGPAAVVSVTTLLDRLDALEQEGGAATDALELLARRGLTGAERARGRTLLTELEVIEGDQPRQATPDPAAEVEREQAELDMWQWYVSWSQTARAVVRRRDLRDRPGIAGSTRELREEEQTDDTATHPAVCGPR